MPGESGIADPAGNATPGAVHTPRGDQPVLLKPAHNSLSDLRFSPVLLVEPLFWSNPAIKELG
jgi:hypothetical protein